MHVVFWFETRKRELQCSGHCQHQRSSLLMCRNYREVKVTYRFANYKCRVRFLEETVIPWGLHQRDCKTIFQFKHVVLLAVATDREKSKAALKYRRVSTKTIGWDEIIWRAETDLVVCLNQHWCFSLTHHCPHTLQYCHIYYSFLTIVFK